MIRWVVYTIVAYIFSILLLIPIVNAIIVHVVIRDSISITEKKLLQAISHGKVNKEMAIFNVLQELKKYQ